MLTFLDLLFRVHALVHSQWPIKNHQAHHFIQGISSSHRRQLCIRIIGRCNLDDIRRDEVDALQPSDDSTKLPGRPASSLWSTSRWSESWIKRVDIDREIYWILVTDTIVDLLDDTFRANGIDLASFGDDETTISIIIIVGQTAQSGSNSSVDVCVVPEQALLSSMEEVRAVVDTGNLGWCTTEDLWSPGIEVGVEVDDCDGAIGTVHASQQWKRDCVVT